MDSLIIAFEVVFPLTVFMFLGYLMKYKNIFDKHTLNVMNRIIFKLFMPVLVFINVQKMNFKNLSNLNYIIYTACSIFVLFMGLVLLIPHLEKDNPRRGVLVHGIMRSNFLVFGLPIAELLCGEDQVSVITAMNIVTVPMFNILGVISLELFRGQKIQWNVILKSLISNPLIIAFISGGIFIGLDIKLPYIFEHTLNEISRITTPLALILLGGELYLNDIKNFTKQLIIGLLGRLLLVPIIFILIAVSMNFRGTELVAIMAVFATPCAVTTYTMAKQMDGDSDLAGQLVAFSSIISVFTIFCWVFFLKHLSLV